MPVRRFTKSIHNFLTTKTVAHYHSRHCKKIQFYLQSIYNLPCFGKSEQKSQSFDVLLKTFTNFSLQKLLQSTTVGIAKKIEFYLKSI